VSFAPPFWLRNPHLQTVWGRLTRPRRMVRLRREILTTPDGDDLILDHLDGKGPRFVLLHGLEGSSNSVYIQGLLSIIQRHGRAATVMNFRSCALDERGHFIMNKRPRLYHSGETTDFDFFINTLKEPVVAIGASLGGNVLLKWLGEHPDQKKVIAAATMSVPYDLEAGSRHLEKTSWGRFYVRRFVITLAKKAALVGGPIDVARASRANTFFEFDEAATAPLHGFAGAEDYWAKSSSINYIDKIKTPTLCISAEDDPFLPREVLSRLRPSPSVTLEITPHGGHTGFIGGKPRYWAEERLVSWLLQSAPVSV
jgi:predicted alpha/beta-fold hydrolase